VKKSAKNTNCDIKIMAKGIDSLYLFLDCEDIINWEFIQKEVQRYTYDEPFHLRGLSFTRVRAWIKTFPTCMKHHQFMFFINRKSAFIKVLSLGFELKGFEGMTYLLCQVLDKLTFHSNREWLDHLKVSRIDTFVDFAFPGDFNFNQFKTRLRKKGIFKSGENDAAVTYYFGSRALLLVRLYTKSEEIKHSGKDYLKAHWKKFDCHESRVWRLEFEFHKDKILELCRFRELSNIDINETKKLFAYGMNSLEYVVETATHNNLNKKKLHPIWQALQAEFDAEYRVTKKQVRIANINYRFKRARTWVISWLVAQELDYDEIERFYIEKFRIDRYDYEKALNRQRMD